MMEERVPIARSTPTSGDDAEMIGKPLPAGDSDSAGSNISSAEEHESSSSDENAPTSTAAQAAARHLETHTSGWSARRRFYLRGQDPSTDAGTSIFWR